MEDRRRQISRIAICSGVKGKIISFVNHIKRIHIAEKSFDYVFCVGDFFGDDDREWEQYKKSGNICPIPIYLIGPNKKEHEKYFKNDSRNPELAPNIIKLGYQGGIRTRSGVAIGWFSGVQGIEEDEEVVPYNFTSDTLWACEVLCGIGGILPLDILLTSPWPANVRGNEGISDNQNVNEDVEKNWESQLLSSLPTRLIPRYHFSGLRGVFHQPRPYRIRNSVIRTQFVGLGDFYDYQTKKQNWFFGFVPSSSEGTIINEDYTIFTMTTKPPKPYTIPKFSVEVNSGSCQFCLYGRKIREHMTICVGEEIYLAGTKGPLVEGHLTLATIYHYKSFADLPSEIVNEISLAKLSLNRYFEKLGRAVVYIEHNIKSSHVQLQVVPIPITKVDRLEKKFKAKFKKYGHSLVDMPPATSLPKIEKNSGGYYSFELPNGKRLFYSVPIPVQPKFPILMAREVLASRALLNVPNRVNWNACKQSADEEKCWANNFDAFIATEEDLVSVTNGLMTELFPMLEALTTIETRLKSLKTSNYS